MFYVLCLFERREERSFSIILKHPILMRRWLHALFTERGKKKNRVKYKTLAPEETGGMEYKVGFNRRKKNIYHFVLFIFAFMHIYIDRNMKT